MGGEGGNGNPSGHGGGKKRKFGQNYGAAKGLGLPYGRQGVMVTLDTNNLNRAGREAVAMLTEAWVELVAQGVKQGPILAPELPKPSAPEDAGPSEAAEAPAKQARTTEAEPSAAPDAGTATAAASSEPKAAKAEAAAPETQAAAQDPGDKDEEDANGATDFSKLLTAEVKDLKDKKKQPFVVHDTGIKTCMFLYMPLATADTPGPCEVVRHIVLKARDSKVLRFRHCIRLLPCTHVVRSDAAEINAAAKAAVAKSIDCTPEATPVTVAVHYEHRASPPDLKRTEIIDAAIAHVPRPPHSVKLKGATKTISIQVIRNAAGIAVLDDFHDLKKFNVKALCEPDEDEKEGTKEGGKEAVEGGTEAKTKKDGTEDA